MKILCRIKFFYNLLVIVLTTALFIIPIIFFFRKQSHFIIYIANRMIKFLIVYKIKVYGTKDDSANIFLINHESVIDILSLEAISQSNIKWIAKEELFNLFWLGKVLKYAGMISVKRTSKSSLFKLIKDIKLKIDSDKNVKIAIFPEGTKNKNSNKLLPFKVGSKLIAEKLNLKIQPIVIINSKSIMDEHLKYSKFSDNIVHIHYLDSFYVDKNNKNWLEELRETMQEKINKENKGLKI